MNSLGKWIRLPLLGLLTVTALGGTGCADYSTALVILGNVPPNLESCSVDASTSVYRSHGILSFAGHGDASFFGYNFTPVLRNDSDFLIYIKGANTKIESRGTEASDAVVAALAAQDMVERGQVTSGSIDAGGLLANVYPILDADQVDVLFNDGAVWGALSAGGTIEVIARTQVEFRMNGNDSETESFDYPLRLCADCVPIDPNVCSSFRWQE